MPIFCSIKVQFLLGSAVQMNDGNPGAWIFWHCILQQSTNNQISFETDIIIHLIHTSFLHSDIFLPSHFYEYSVSINNSELNLALCVPTECQKCNAHEHPSALTIVTTI